MILIVQKDFTKVTELIRKCHLADIDEKKIFVTIEPLEIRRYLNTKSITHILIDSSIYNYEISNLIKEFDVKTIITNTTSSQKTIRLITDKTLNYMDRNASPSVIKALLNPYPIIENVS